MMRYLIATLFLLAFWVSSASAEGGCPPGQYPQQGQGWQTCVPIPGYTGGQGGNENYRQARWQDQWQAIATDTPKGVLGISKGMLTGDDAESAAVADCQAKGGVTCLVEVSLVNGCVAMVVGSSRKNVRSAPSSEEAQKAAMSQCQSNDTNCKIYYSACSLPKRLQ